MNLTLLAKYLEDQEVGTRGSDLFIQFMPPRVQLGILLKEPFAGTQIDHELPGYRKGRFQVVARSKNYEAGKDLIESVVAALTIKSDTNFSPEMLVKHIRPVHEPVSYPISEGAVIEFSVNFDAVYVIV